MRDKHGSHTATESTGRRMVCEIFKCSVTSRTDHPVHWSKFKYAVLSCLYSKSK
jgi:hypothetical protein